MRKLAVVVGAGVAVALPALASAICGRPMLAVVELHRAMSVPRNARVRVRLQPGWRARILCSAAAARDACRDTDPEFLLRSSPARGGGAADVATTLRSTSGGPAEVVELIPDAPLDARRAYEVWVVDRDAHERARIVGAFTVGDRQDQTAPDWAGALSAQRLTQTPGMLEECGIPQALVTIANASDDQTPNADLRIALWVELKRGDLDFAKPPRTYVPMPDPRLSPTHALVVAIGSSEADLAEFVLPSTGPVALGMRVVDLAGNPSAPSVVELR